MESLIRLAIMALTESNAADRIAASSRRWAGASLCALVALVLVVTSVGCTSAALWIWGIPRFGPVGAPLAVAGILLVLSIAAFALMRRTLRPRRMAPSPHNAASTALLADAMRLCKSNKSAALIAALVAGLAAGRSER